MRFRLSEENDALLRRIDAAVRNGGLSHAYIIEGGRHIDKEAFARAFIKGILCPKDLGENCGDCSICARIDHDNHEDLIWLEKAGATVPVKLIRESLARLNTVPRGDRHIMIIRDADSMNEEGQNTLLKTLEEPPGDSILILLSENTEHLLPTVRSRCVIYHIEGSVRAADAEISELADRLTGLAVAGAPYYQLKDAAEKAPKSREGLEELLECMEEGFRGMLLGRDSNGLPHAPEEIGHCIETLEASRRKLERGMAPRYIMKQILLEIGG